MTAKRRRQLIISGSVVAHAAVLAAFVISGMWKIEKLDAAPTDSLNLSVVAEPALAGGTPHPKEHAEFIPKDRTQQKPKVDHLTQPTVNEAHDPTPTAAPASDDGPTDGPTGDTLGDTIGNGGHCTTPPCGTDKEAPAIPTPPVEVTLTPLQISALRVSGDTDIHPSDPDKITMMRDGVHHAMGIFKICVSATGSIDAITKLRSTKYPDYDQRIVSTMQTWKYRPYQMADGRFTRACSTVTFSYTMQ